MRARSAAFALALVAAATAAPPFASPATARSASATGVLAITDTGINPYHAVFRDDSPRAYRHPATYIPGFPKSARRLPLTLDAKTYWDAVRADCRLWEKVYPNRLYWIPGTKIVGIIPLERTAPPDCSDPNPQRLPMLDYDFHGTMVASRAVGNGYGACPECRLVFVQGYEGSQDWIAGNTGWIDAQSNSWGYLPYWDPTGRIGFNSPEFVRDVEAAAQRHLAFWATGNGAVTSGTGGVGHPSLLDPRLTPSAMRVGGHDSGQVSLWHGFPPHVVSDACRSPAAHHESLDRSRDDLGGGTSGATPYAAGLAVKMLIEARALAGDASTGVRDGTVAAGRRLPSGPLADGKLTLAEWRELVLKTATRRPAADRNDGQPCDLFSEYQSTPLAWRDVPDAYPEFVHIGYGALDGEAFALASDVLEGNAGMPDRAATDAFFAADDEGRAGLHTVFSGP